MKKFKYPLITILSTSVVGLIAVAQLTSCSSAKNSGKVIFVDFNISKNMNSNEFAKKLSEAAPAEITDLQYSGSDYNESKDILDTYLFDIDNMKNKTSYLLSYYRILSYDIIPIIETWTYNILTNNAKTGFGAITTVPKEIDNVDIAFSITTYSIFSPCTLKYYDSDEQEFVTFNYYGYKYLKQNIAKNSELEDQVVEYTHDNYTEFSGYYYDGNGGGVELGFGGAYGEEGYVGVLVPSTLFPNFTFVTNDYPE